MRGQQPIALGRECGYEQVDNVWLIIHHQNGRRAATCRTYVIHGGRHGVFGCRCRDSLSLQQLDRQTLCCSKNL